MRSVRGRVALNGSNNGRPFIRKPAFLHNTFDAYRSFHPHKLPCGKTKDADLTSCLTRKGQELAPKKEELKLMQTLMAKIHNALDRLKVDPPGFSSGETFSVRQVGSFRKGTLLAGHKTADLSIQVKGTPTEEGVVKFGDKVLEELQKDYPSSVLTLNHGSFSFTITFEEGAVCCLITSTSFMYRKADASGKRRLMRSHYAAIEHARWFDDNVTSPAIRPLVRLIKDTRLRFEGLKPLTPWMIDLLCCYSVLAVERNPLSLTEGYKRVFQLLAAGIFTPGSVGIPEPYDPCGRVHDPLTLEEQDTVCMTAQNLCRHLLLGNHKTLLGYSEVTERIEKETCIFNNVVIVPTGEVYEKRPDRVAEDEDLEDSDWENDEAVMQTE